MNNTDAEAAAATTSATPSAKGARWTPDEENQLLNEIKQGMDVAQIAHIHNRTVGGITGRMREIAYRMHAQGFPMETIMRDTSLTVEVILETIEAKKAKAFAGTKRARSMSPAPAAALAAAAATAFAARPYPSPAASTPPANWEEQLASMQANIVRLEKALYIVTQQLGEHAKLLNDKNTNKRE